MGSGRNELETLQRFGMVVKEQNCQIGTDNIWSYFSELENNKRQFQFTREHKKSSGSLLYQLISFDMKISRKYLHPLLVQEFTSL